MPWTGYSFGALMRVIRERSTVRWPENVCQKISDAYIRLVERSWSTNIEERPRDADVYEDFLKTHVRRLAGYVVLGCPSPKTIDWWSIIRITYWW